jgi:putative DNA methylase
MTYKKKLIEVALPLAKINDESAREKSVRHGHPSTLHMWWARRPFGSARALIWASLINDPSAEPDKFPTSEAQDAERERLFSILESICSWESVKDEQSLAVARQELMKSCDGRLPTICDPFGGGGAIPLEALRLGLPTVTGDLNPVAVLIQRAMMEVPQRFAGYPAISEANKLEVNAATKFEGLATDVEFYSQEVLKRVKHRVGHLYSDDGEDSAVGPMAYIWVRTVPSPDPTWNGNVPLVGNWTVRNKAGRPIVWVKPIINFENQQISYEVIEGGTRDEGTVKRAKGTCVATGAAITNEAIRSSAANGTMGADLVCKIYDSPSGRRYSATTAADKDKALSELRDVWLPEGKMPTHSQYMGAPRYGLDEWKKLFLPRQAAVVASFIEVMDELSTEIKEKAQETGLPVGEHLRDGGSGAIAYAEAISTYLAFVLNRAVVRWNTLSVWHTGRETIEQIFRMQAYQMTWMFAEANPFSKASGGWEGQITWVTKVLRDLPDSDEATVDQISANVRVKTVTPNVLITDPPYYDSVPYSDLSDFFYVFIRKTLSRIWPDECATLVTPKHDELVADHERHGSKQAAKEHFENGMKEVFSAAAEASDDEYPASIYYAFRSNEQDSDGTASTGWETFLEGLIQGGWSVIRTWPIRTEMTAGLKESKNMLASSIVLVCRRRSIAAPLVTKSEFIAALRREMPPELEVLLRENIAPVDLAQSAIGPGMAVFSRYARVLESDGKGMTVRTALALINEVLAEVLSGEESEFDADTRFAVTWFEQFGHNPGSYGDAETLAKAKNTTVGGVVSAGIAETREGRVRLLERADLSDHWNPIQDSRLTVWETTQHLIRALEVSELDAAEMLRVVGAGFGERARQLGYLLYGICDRKKWAGEAASYNMLVTAWPEIEKLSRQELAVESSPETLF